MVLRAGTLAPRKAWFAGEAGGDDFALIQDEREIGLRSVGVTAPAEELLIGIRNRFERDGLAAIKMIPFGLAATFPFPLTIMVSATESGLSGAKRHEIVGAALVTTKVSGLLLPVAASPQAPK